MRPRVARTLPTGPLAPLRQAGGFAGSAAGSSAWVVSSRFTRRGEPLVAADVHAAPRVPAAVYEAHLRGGDLEVAGATLPGVPVFWIGFNRRLAWAATHAPVVTMDLVEENALPATIPPGSWSATDGDPFPFAKRRSKCAGARTR